MLRPRRRQRGFTLLEMIVVLAIIGTLAGMAMPSITASLWQQRQSGAAQDLARFLRGVRELTRRTGIAHNAVFLARDTQDLGVIDVWMGMNNRCRLTDWIYARTTGTTLNHAPVMRFEMAAFNPFDDSTPINPGGPTDVVAMRVREVVFNNAAGVRMVSPTDGPVLPSGELCFEPSGDVYYRTPMAVTDSPTTVMDLQHQLLRFEIVRLQRGSTSTRLGEDRHVILSPGGVARVRQ